MKNKRTYSDISTHSNVLHINNRFDLCILGFLLDFLISFLDIINLFYILHTQLCWSNSMHAHQKERDYAEQNGRVAHLKMFFSTVALIHI